MNPTNKVSVTTTTRGEREAPLRRSELSFTEVTIWSAGSASRRLSEGFQRSDSIATVEGILVEFARCAEMCPVKPIPNWLRTVHGWLNSNFRRGVTLPEVALIAKVHQVHLAQSFRECFSTSVGQFLRRKRIAHAFQLLLTTDEPLAGIDLECGVSDQSHFSATLRRQSGLTPARFRQLACAAS
jgi:AraC-like DNA-binding protein